MGSIRLQCANGQWLPKRGLAKGQKFGSTQTFNLSFGIDKVIIYATKYINGIGFISGNRIIAKCGTQTGRQYVAKNRELKIIVTVFILNFF